MYDFSQNEIMTNVRTKFKMPHNHKTTGNTGDLIPIYRKEILPGDFIKMDLRTLIKMTTPNFQTMDIAFADIAFYFIPRRLTWKHWKNFQGEKQAGPRGVEPEYTIPKTSAPTEIWYEPARNVTEDTEGTYYVKTGIGIAAQYTPVTLPGNYNEDTTYYIQCTGWKENTIADYLGIPTKVAVQPVDSAYFRAYNLVWNEWYRDQNRQDFTDFTDDDANTVGSNGSNYVTDPIGGGKCLKVAKIHDYFTSTLLTPAGREQVMLPLGTIANVRTTNYSTVASYNDLQPLRWNSKSGAIQNGDHILLSKSDVPEGQNFAFTQAYSNPTAGQEFHANIYPENLVADLSTATAATVNQLRLAFQLQKIFEANNRSGTRYVEILKNRWNVTPSDARLQRPEYLGGKRIPLNIEMVVQTSSTNTESPLGQIAGFSNTFDNSSYFSKGFEEHGIILGFVYVRHQRTYQQGLHKMFTRTNMEDFYMPEFQNIGEVPVYNYEIFTSGNQTKDMQVFGYQEYAAEYRYEQNRISGQFRSNAENSFDNWHYADDYDDTPVNGEEWIVENGDAVDRTLTVQSDVANQFYFDFYFDETDVRTMPPHSIPGFIDHH